MWASRTDRLNNLKSIVLQKLIKNWIYAKAVKSCDKIYFYTPETEKLILSNLPKKLRPLCVRKKVITSLGFDPDEFYFDNGIRNEIRKKYNINDDECVLITSTRIKSSKKLEKIIDIVNEKHLNNIQLRYFIIGFFEDKYCKRLKQYIEKQSKPKKIHCFPFLSHKEIYKLYCGADIGIWTQAAISIQEAMGTGLPIILENKSSVNHLITNGVNGWYFNKNNLNNVFNKVLKTFFSGTPQKKIRF
jgi:glycosyltransferase involved in cell wall biosynthesis